MRARTAEIEITYNGVPASDKMADSELECTYTDPASGEADSLDISIHDRERKWINSWLPQTGDRLTAAIALKNWDSSGADRRLGCGSFVLDTFTFSGWPISGTISAVSVPADGNFRARKRSKVWENITLQEIGKDIAGRAGITLVWDVGSSQKAEQPAEAAPTSPPKVGDIVEFTGTRHYVSSNGDKGYKCKGGKAKVTLTYNGKHPYHLIAVSGGGSTVYGWVDAADIVGAAASSGGSTGSAPQVGDTVDFTGTRHYVSSSGNTGYACKPGKAKVTQTYNGKHPYHLIHISGGGSTVYGWVDAADVKQAAAESSEYEFTIKCEEQEDQTDCEFYAELCEKYGLAMKVYNRKIVVYDREEYKKKPAVLMLTETDLQAWSWQQRMSGTYTGGEFAYTPAKTSKEIKVTLGTQERALKLSGKADSQADAERQLKAAINKENHGRITLSATIMGNAALAASQCVEVQGLGALSGKYYIDKVTHNIGGGYTMDLEMSLVE